MKKGYLTALLRFLLWLAMQNLSLNAIGATDAADHILTREVFRDPSAAMLIPAVLGASFTPSGEIYAGGYTKDVIWMRLLVRPAADDSALVLRILPSYLNDITLYAPDSTQRGQWRASFSGNRIPWKDRPWASVGLGFPIQPTAETTYYLRLQTTSNALLQVQALTAQQALQEEINAMLWQAFYMMIILWIVSWALHDYWITRDRVIIVFALAYLVYLLYVLTILGYLSPLFPKATVIPEATFWIVMLGVVSSLVFHRQLLLLFDLKETARWALNALLVGWLFSFGLLLVGHQAAALLLTSLLTLIAAPVLFLCSLATRQEAAPGRRRLKIYYALLLLSVAGYISPILGLTTASSWTLYGALIQGVVSALLFGNLLHARSKHLVQQNAQTEFRLHVAERLAAAHKEQLIEQGRFTALLTHELKNPLAAIRLSIDGMPPDGTKKTSRRSRRIERALDDIDALVERCVQTDRMEQGRQGLPAVPVEINELIANWQAQHPTADRVQVSISADSSPVMADPQLLAMVINNLLDNAVKYSPPESVVTVNLHADTDAQGRAGLLLKVANPPGLAGFPDPIRVFEKYYRGATASRQNGLGLGLYLVKGLAERLGGHVEYIPHPDRVIFRLWLPLSPS